MHNPLKWLLALFVAVGSDVAFAETAVRSFDIRGKITSSSDFGRVAKVEHAFRCRLNSPSWIIEMHVDEAFKNGAPPGDKGYRIIWPDQTLASDGTNFFFRVDTHKVVKAPPAGESRPGAASLDNGIAARGPGATPFGNIGNELLCTWYALLSRDYFSGRPVGSLHPLSAIDFKRFHETGLEIIGHWALDRTGLPRMIQASNFNGTAGFQRVVSGEAGSTTPYSVQFEVRKTRPYSEWEVPVDVKVDFFGYPGGSLSSIQRMESFEILVESISEFTEPFSGLPDLDGVFMISDYSTWFMVKPTDSLMISTGAWPTEADVKRDNEQKLRLGNPHSSKSHGLPAFFFVTIVLLTTALLAARFRNLRNRNE